MTISQILQTLSTEQYNQLMYAFENEIDQVVDLGDHWIGVNTNLKPLIREGVWSYGRKQSRQKESKNESITNESAG